MATLNSAASQGSPYRIPPEPSRLPSILLAAAMHAILVAFLWVGIKWQNNAPVAVEAEVWDMKTQAAAPPTPPAPAPEPEPEPKPEPKPEPEPPRVAKAVEPPPAPKPDIALERQKQKELKQKQLAEEKREREELKKKELAKKELEKKELEKKELEKKQLAEKKAAEKLKARQAAEEQKKLDKLRDAEMRRITGAAGAAPKATAPRIDSGYLASITSKIKSTTSYLGSTDMAGNPRVQFKVDQAPTGEIMSVRLVKSSGVPAFDDAVEKGIIKSSPLPKKKDGTVERTLEIGFSMKDLK